jgi:hypothetical protein
MGQFLPDLTAVTRVGRGLKALDQDFGDLFRRSLDLFSRTEFASAQAERQKRIGRNY